MKSKGVWHLGGDRPQVRSGCCKVKNRTSAGLATTAEDTVRRDNFELFNGA